MLAVSTGVCGGCGGIHDRNVNSVINLVCAWRLCRSVGGNELPTTVAPPSQASRLREAGLRTRSAAEAKAVAIGTLLLRRMGISTRQ